MKAETYEKIKLLSHQYNGYMRTSELLSERITNRQIKSLLEEGILEKVSVGAYWLHSKEVRKPDNYKIIEVSLSNPDAVICADSACFYNGLINIEPPVLSVATKRSDRKKMAMNFQISRHYYSEEYFDYAINEIKTDYGVCKVYDINRSVCDCIRFQDHIEPDVFSFIIESYQKSSQKQIDRLMAYAKTMKAAKKASDILG